MKGEWTHAICVLCWYRKTDCAKPAVVKGGHIETCCYCGRDTIAGIFVKEDPATVHKEEEDEVRGNGK